MLRPGLEGSRLCGDPVGRWKSETGMQRYVVKEIIVLDTWSFILLGNLGRQSRTLTSVLSTPGLREVGRFYTSFQQPLVEGCSLGAFAHWHFRLAMLSGWT